MKVFDTILKMIHIDGLRQKVQELPLQKKPFLFIVLALLIIFATSGIIIGIATIKRGDANTLGRSKVYTPIPETLVFMHPLLPPADTPFPDDYLLFRKQRKIWDNAEAQQWFTPPTDSMLEQLHSSNNAMIHNLLETAP
jgi:hypothetical protein